MNQASEAYQRSYLVTESRAFAFLTSPNISQVTARSRLRRSPYRIIGSQSAQDFITTILDVCSSCYSQAAVFSISGGNMSWDAMDGFALS